MPEIKEKLEEYEDVYKRQGDYSVKMGITSENKLADLPAQIHDIDFKTGYISKIIYAVSGWFLSDICKKCKGKYSSDLHLSLIHI